MKRPKRKGKPRLPEFPPVDRLVVGQAFNPLRLFVSGSAHRAIAQEKKLSAAGKWVWVVLADQCYAKGYDWHSEQNLAELAGMSRRQFQRHLRRLKKLHLVHIETELGRSNRTWLLFHPLFALCQPLTPVTSDVPPTTETSQGVRQKRRTHEQDHEQDASRGTRTFVEATSYSGVVDLRDGKTVNGSGHEEGSPEVPITDRASTPRIRLERTPGWYSLTDTEKRNRFEQIDRLAREMDYFWEHLESPDKNIRRQARREVDRRLAQLIARGAVERPVKWKGEP